MTDWDKKSWPPPDTIRSDEVMTTLWERVNELERRLEFFNGHGHFKDGPPRPRAWLLSKSGGIR